MHYGANRDVIDYSLQLLAPQSTISHEQKCALQRQLISLLGGSDKILNPQSVLVNPVELDSRWGLISATAHFNTRTGVVHVKEDMELVLTLTSSFPLIVAFSKIEVFFNMNQYNLTIVGKGGSSGAILTTSSGGATGRNENKEPDPIEDDDPANSVGLNCIQCSSSHVDSIVCCVLSLIINNSSFLAVIEV